ncbi:DUF58 domain-containing protein [Salirhabdus salicampi]|uniref:DUF58 domain-containing protein n=1 Tax=Salirhabdus salicampi TaxID=476102 RepID=UPI0020C4D60C|nr:DUF58 domain-containing protein [Salirhabdus salicampi]MCP8617841.1 DUF58 domain-containing protein [Salirhabdus salicampi]
MKKWFSYTLKTIGVVVALASLFSYAMFQGGFVSWFLFFSFLPVLLYSFSILVYPLSRIRVERKISRRFVEAGSTTMIKVTVKRSGFFPLYYCVLEDIIPETLFWKDTREHKFKYMLTPGVLFEKKGAKRIIFPLFRKEFSFEYGIEYIPRGEHRFEQVQVKIGDLIGLVRKEKCFAVHTNMTAYPVERNISIHKEAQSFEEGVAPSFNRLVNNTTVVSGVREYAPGDRVSWIDWKASARKNEMMTKEFEQEKSHDMLITLDTTYKQPFNWLTFEGAIETTFALVNELRKEASQLVFTSLGARRYTFQVQHNSLSQEKIRHHLTKLRPSEGNYAELLKAEVGRMPQGFILLSVTSTVTEELFLILSQLKQRCPRIIVFVVKPKKSITDEEQKWFKFLTSNGIVVNLVTENKLLNKSIEVNA